MVSRAPFLDSGVGCNRGPFLQMKWKTFDGGAELGQSGQSVLKQPAYRSLEPQDIDQALVAEIGMLTPNVPPRKLAEACLVFRSVYFGADRTLLK
jgi:hypothetical protein